MMQDSGRMMVECGICLEEHQKDELETHQEMCMVRLVFRCSHCSGDYMNKEGLWNHLDLHEITDENKEFNYQELKTRHKLYQCEVCNDQRAYSESYYWKHVQEVHDGFFLKCAACGEYFQNEQLRNDHVFSNCKTNDQPPCAAYKPMKADEMNSALAHLNPTEKTHIKTLKEVNDDFPGLLVDPEISESSRDITDLKIKNKGRKQKQKKKCPYCPKVCTADTLPSHLALCESKQFSCEICHAKFQIRGYLTRHMRRVHRSKRKDNSTTAKRTKSSNEQIAADTESNMIKEDIQAMNLQKLIQNPLLCPHCGTEFNNLVSVVSHIKCCHRPVKCDICDITIYGATAAKFHKVTKHEEPSFECEKCSKKMFFKGIYVAHIAVCNGVYRAPKHMKRPEQNKTNNEQQKDIAVEETKFIPCLSNVTDSPDVSEHEGHREAEDSAQKAQNSPKVVPENPVSGKSLNKCIYCEKLFPNYTSLTEHFLYTHVPSNCKICGITFTNLNRLLYHKKRIHIASKFSCPKCSKKCITKQIYEKHVQFCEKKTDPCNNCGQWFKDLFALERHVALGCGYKNFETSNAVRKYNMRPVKLGLPVVKCSDCGKEFHGAENLRTHVTRIHQENKCDICGIIIFGNSKFRWHKVQSHSEPKYTCPICGKKLFKIRMYDRHYSICKLKKYTCDICGHKFKLSNSLKQHKVNQHPVEADLSNTKIKKHKNTRLRIKKQSNACTICGIVFTEQSEVHHHMRTKHSGKYFKCSHCSKIFTAKQTLNLHEPICAGRKFSCDLCGQKFKLRVGVKRHKRRVHSEEIAKQNAIEEIQRENSALTFEKTAALQTILKHPDNSDDSQFDADYTLLQDENITIKMEIQVEDTMLQE